MSTKNIDFSNQTHFYLTFIKQEGYDKWGCKTWLLECVCGNRIFETAYRVITGRHKSCGCYARETARKLLTRHGLANHPLHSVWSGMMKRCYKSYSPAYINYGNRGIKVCKRWHLFENFFQDMAPSYAPGLTLERKKNDRNYSAKNCKWATAKEQAQNKRNTVRIKHLGEEMSFKHFVDTFGCVSYATAFYRLVHHSLLFKVSPKEAGMLTPKNYLALIRSRGYVHQKQRHQVGI